MGDPLLNAHVNGAGDKTETHSECGQVQHRALTDKRWQIDPMRVTWKHVVCVFLCFFTLNSHNRKLEYHNFSALSFLKCNNQSLSLQVETVQLRWHFKFCLPYIWTTLQPFVTSQLATGGRLVRKWLGQSIIYVNYAILLWHFQRYPLWLTNGCFY